MIPPKRARQCIFCSDPGGSKEHIWPEWMHGLLDRSERRYDKLHISNWPGEEIKVKGRKRATGGPENITVRAVCNGCNNGWMNRLERDARPFLQPLVEGEPIVLDGEQMRTVAEWIVMKCMVAEHALPDNAVTTRYYREIFRHRREIPHFFHVYVASHKDTPRAALVRSSYCISVRPPVPSPPLGGVAKNVQQFTIVLGKVFAVVFAARADGLVIEQRLPAPDLYATSRIWPPDHHELVWPRKPVFSRKYIDDIALALERVVRASVAFWFKDKIS